MKDLLKFIIKGLVDNPKEVKIEQSQEGEEVILNFTVAPSDMGKVIGKNGQIIRAVRTLLRTCAFRTGKRVQIILTDTKKQTG